MHTNTYLGQRLYFSIFGWKNSAEGFLTMQDHLSFLH